jgi:hypothetical protein
VLFAKGNQILFINHFKWEGTSHRQKEISCEYIFFMIWDREELKFMSGPIVKRIPVQSLWSNLHFTISKLSIFNRLGKTFILNHFSSDCWKSSICCEDPFELLFLSIKLYDTFLKVYILNTCSLIKLNKTVLLNFLHENFMQMVSTYCIKGLIQPSIVMKVILPFLIVNSTSI